MVYYLPFVYLYEWLIFVVNVGKYTMHGFYGSFLGSNDSYQTRGVSRCSDNCLKKCFPFLMNLDYQLVLVTKVFPRISYTKPDENV